MAKHAEVIYETGDKSVVGYDDEDELKEGLSEQHRRALAGEDAGPQAGRPAERIKRVLLYDEHPADLVTGKAVDAATLTSLIEGMTDKDGKVDMEQLIRAMRDEVSPLYPNDQGRHESLYKGQEVGELDLTFLSGGGESSV